VVLDRISRKNAGKKVWKGKGVTIESFQCKKVGGSLREGGNNGSKKLQNEGRVWVLGAAACLIPNDASDLPETNSRFR
jgi:hypothetical protein